MEQLEKLPYSSIAGALKYQAEVRPEKCAILYPDPQTNWREYGSLTYRQYNNVTNYLAKEISKYFSLCSSEGTVTCGLLAVGGLEYLLSQYALLKLDNVILFPISARNSQPAVEHLLRETKTTCLLTTSQYLPMIKTIQEQQEFQSLKILLLDSEQFKTEELLKHKDFECHLTTNVIREKTNQTEELNKVVIILHR
jgi:acyl-CoA synthetase (AMP-forming)/AMP-acid ligase II